MEKKQTLLFLLIVGTAFWGISFSVTKLGIGYHSPFLFLFYRFVLASLIMAIIFWKQVRQVSRESIWSGASLAIPLMLGISLQTLGIKYTAAAQCAFVAGTTVIIIPIVKTFFYRQSAPLKIWMAALISLVGLFIISVKGGFTVSTGDLFTLAGSVAFAIYIIQVERQAAARDILPTIVPMFVTSAIISFGLVFTDTVPDWLPADHNFWIGIVFCALFSTAYMYTVSNIAQRFISAERVAIIYLLEPVFGAIAAYFILDENMGWRLLLGGTLIFAGTLIAELKLKTGTPGELEALN